MSYEQPAPPAVPASDQAAPLWAPLYGASFGTAIKRFLAKYSDFTGRASRSEFWWVYLFVLIVNVAISLIGTIFGGAGVTVDAAGNIVYAGGFWVSTILSLIWLVATFVPWLALVWRRLHDGNFPGPLWFLIFIPVAGPIILLVLTLLPSKPEGARFDRPRT